MTDEILWRHISHIDFQSGDRHLIAKKITEVMVERDQFKKGDCPHRPDPVQVLKANESNRADGAPCVWCEQDLAIVKVIWGLKSKLPNVPRSA
jgi:hypothetical protein